MCVLSGKIYNDGKISSHDSVEARQVSSVVRGQGSLVRVQGPMGGCPISCLFDMCVISVSK